MFMNIHFVQPRRELRHYVQSIWVLESSTGLPASDVSLAAPNGCPKLILNCENSIISATEGHAQQSRKDGLYFVGTRDVSVLISTPPGRTKFIGIEFYPQGAFPIFGIPMSDLTNHVFPVETLLSDWGRSISGILPELAGIKKKIDYLQNRLVGMLRRRSLHNPLVDYCVDLLRSTNGLITISDLERDMGYTRRYLEMLFKDHIGFSPKVLAGIFRFQKFYRQWASGRSYDGFKDELYDYYYDQSHFTKEFKRMTGFSPVQFSTGVRNEFGRRLLLH